MSKRTDPAMSVCRDGDYVVIDDIEIVNGKPEILRTSYLDAETAIRIGRRMAQIGGAIKAPLPGPSLSTRTDPYSEDKRS